jgi:hypothetical protein
MYSLPLDCTMYSCILQFEEHLIGRPDELEEIERLNQSHSDKKIVTLYLIYCFLSIIIQILLL